MRLAILAFALVMLPSEGLISKRWPSGSPPPCGEGQGVGVLPKTSIEPNLQATPSGTHPHPCPFPTRGKGTLAISVVARFIPAASDDDPSSVPAKYRKPLQSTYVTPDDIRLERVLPPPPSPGSAEGRADLAAVEAAVKARTAEDNRRIEADLPCTALAFAHDIMGPDFSKAKVPLTLAFIERAFADSELAVLAAKKTINRARPYTLNPELRTLGHRSASASYPSGHAACGRLMAIILAAMVPEKAEALFARAELYGRNRMMAGTHFPSDLAAGATSGSVIAAALFRNEHFRADFLRASDETRAALGEAKRSRSP